MTNSSRIQIIVWSGLGIVIAAIVAAFVVSRISVKPLPVYNDVPEFTLTNQSGAPVTLETLHGQIWIADVIFTRCPSQCLHLSTHMKDLQAKLPKDVTLVSLTTDPTYDTPPILKKYAGNFSKADNWIFLTGDKRVINKVAVEGLKLAVQETPENERENPNDLFIHSTKIVLVDRQGRVRGYFDGDDPQFSEQVQSSIRQLEREES
jgi:protein SCO1/2